MDVAGHDADLALARLDNTGTVGSDESRLRDALHHRLHLDHVESRDALGDADDEVNLSFNSLRDGLGSERWRHVDHTSLSASFLDSLGNGAEDGQTKMLGARLLGVNTADDLCPVRDRLLGVEGSLQRFSHILTYVLASHALDEDLRVLVDEHVRLSLLRVGSPLESVDQGRNTLGRSHGSRQHG